MADTDKILSANDAQLADTMGTLYTVPASTTAYVRTVTLHNTNTTAETVKLYIANSGTGAAANLVWHGTLEANETIILDFIFMPLAAGAKICGETTTASKVNVIMAGFERA